jgi:hypothetical protein
MSETLTYIPVGDYLIPDIRLSEPPEELTEPLGRYARIRRAFLKEHRTVQYNRLLLIENLYPHLRETEAAANKRLLTVMESLTGQTALPSKQSHPMDWTAAMNTLKAQAEEMVLNELIYA